MNAMKTSNFRMESVLLALLQTGNSSSQGFNGV